MFKRLRHAHMDKRAYLSSRSMQICRELSGYRNHELLFESPLLFVTLLLAFIIVTAVSHEVSTPALHRFVLHHHE